MNRDTCHFTTGVKAWNDDIVAFAIDCERLTIYVGRNPAHHVVTSGNNWDRLFHRVGMGKGARELANAWQTAFQNFFTEVVEFKEDVVAVFAAAATFKNLQHH